MPIIWDSWGGGVFWWLFFFFLFLLLRLGGLGCWFFGGVFFFFSFLVMGVLGFLFVVIFLFCFLPPRLLVLFSGVNEEL